MKIKIDGNGNLWLDRGGKLQRQDCPFDEYNETHNPPINPCGDWCALFNDQHIHDTDHPSLELCRAFYDDIKVIDERE